MLPPAVRKRLPRNVVVMEVSARESRNINRRYREKNKPTNVLSFRYGPDLSRRSPMAKADYGEIIICPSVIRREAKAQKNSYDFQKNWMIMHGLLHLAGLHHEKLPKDAKKFYKFEQKLLKKLRN